MSFSEPVDIGTWRIYGGDYRAIEATVYAGDAPADLSHFTDWRAQWRTYASSRSSVDLTVDAERASEGIVVVSIPGELSGVDGQLRSGVFDVQASDEGVVRTFFRGTIVWEGDVTHG